MRSFKHQCPCAGQTALGRDISPSCNEPASRPREIGAGLLSSLLKSVVTANKLYLNAAIRLTSVSAVLTLCFSNSRYPSGNSTSLNLMGHAAVGASSKVKLCSSITFHLRAASTALSVRDSTIPASYAFAIEGRTYDQDCTNRGYPLTVATCSITVKMLRRERPRWRWRFPLW